MNPSRYCFTSTSLSFPDQLSFLWLAVAGSQLIFSNGIHIASIATWPGLVFLVSFLHTQKTVLGLVRDYLVNVVDYQEYFLSAVNHYTASGRGALGYLQVEGVRTLYITLCDFFPWLCMLGLVMLSLIGKYLYSRKDYK